MLIAPNSAWAGFSFPINTVISPPLASNRAHNQDFQWSNPLFNHDTIIFGLLENALLTWVSYSLLIYADPNPQHVC